MKARTRSSSRRPPMHARKNQPASGPRSVFTPPYFPSWVDRLTAFVDRLPGPPWGYYFGLGMILLLVIVAAQWTAGTNPFEVISRSHLIGALLTPYALGLMHYLDRVAVAAIQSFRPALRGGGAGVQGGGVALP